MTDVLTRKQRKYCMSRIRGKDTAPEIAIRRLVNRLGYRFRLHKRELPGCPDIVLPRHKKVIFVHGCFWHMHNCRYGRVKPATNSKFWQKKREGNVARDKRNMRKLRKEGWQVLKIWECETSNSEKLAKKLKRFLVSS